MFFRKGRKSKILNKRPLHCATDNNSKEMFKILISKGADVNAEGNKSENLIKFLLINIIESK